MLPYALTIFTGAFLLFQVQPLIGKYILPWFGGGPGVWTTCLLFFQTLLLGGYAYAHFTSTLLRPRFQALLHVVLLVLSLTLLPIAPAETWKAHPPGDPTWQILLLLTATIGLPYFVLSATGPLIQQWFSQTRPGVSPYRLYSLSNAGSLLALLSYPVFFELQFTRHQQAIAWSSALGIFAVFCGYCALQLWQRSRTGKPVPPPSVVAAPVVLPPDGGATPSQPGRQTAASSAPAAASAVDVRPAPAVDKLFWLCLPAIASILLLATTNKLCQEVAVIPFLWVLPLSLYLLSFIISFDHARWYHRGVFSALLVLGAAAVAQILPVGHDAPIHVQIVGYSVALFAACMVCHGELYRLKPPPRQLTSFFLFVAGGGALGGFLVAIVAPLVLDDYRELQIGLWLLSYAVGVLCFQQRSRQLALGAAVGLLAATSMLPWLRSFFDDSEGFGSEFLSFFRLRGLYISGALVLIFGCLFDLRRRALLRDWRPQVTAFIMILSVGLGAVFIVQWGDRGSVPILFSTRNFYGTLKVYNYHPDDEEENYHLLLHGATTHGLQFTDPVRSIIPTTYYSETSGIGMAFENLPAGPRSIGLVGLGTGTLAIYGRKGDRLRVYEIDPAVVEIAGEYFSYLEYAQAEVAIAMGDARVSLERELAEDGSQQFDILVLDAFSSDAIPVHLLTVEAFDIYRRHLKPDGVIAVHISNRYLNLRPMVERLAEHLDLGVTSLSEDYEPEWWIYSTSWMLLSPDKSWIQAPGISDLADGPDKRDRPNPLWTDDFTNLYSILK